VLVVNFKHKNYPKNLISNGHNFENQLFLIEKKIEAIFLESFIFNIMTKSVKT